MMPGPGADGENRSSFGRSRTAQAGGHAPAAWPRCQTRPQWCTPAENLRSGAVEQLVPLAGRAHGLLRRADLEHNLDALADEFDASLPLLQGQACTDDRLDIDAPLSHESQGGAVAGGTLAS